MTSHHKKYPNSSKHQYTLTELTRGLEVTIRGDANCVISNVATIQHAQAGHVSFLTNALYRKYLAETKASAVILTEADAADYTGNAIITRNPYYIYAKIAEFFDISHEAPSGIHPTAVIGKECQIDLTASIGPHCVLGNYVTIGANTVIGAGTTIGDHTEIGEKTTIDTRVTIYHHIKIGKRTRIASGVVLGADGFGFANQNRAWYKVPQLGGVSIGDDVDIGANTTIDRGAIADTVIENGVKLDNLIQIGHNVHIGENTIMAGCTGVAGSTTIGKNCMIGGASCINGHIVICDNVMLTGTTGVVKSILEPGMYSSGIVGAVTTQEFRKNNARFYRLENLMQRVKALEAIIEEKRET